MLWSTPVSQSLPSELRAAMTLSSAEQASLLGEYPGKSLKSQPGNLEYSSAEMNKEGFSKSNESNVRNWLKCIRDSR